jgi:hypothetical protein
MSEVKFHRTTRRMLRQELAQPFPQTLLEQRDLAEQVARHRAVVAREQELRQQVVRLERELLEAERSDTDKAEQAALAGKARPRAQKAASARRKLEEAQTELGAFAHVVGRSADLLANRGLPRFPVAAEQAEQGTEQALDTVADLLAAADRELTTANRLTSEALWLRSGPDSRGRLDPFRESSDPAIHRFRAALSAAHSEFQQRRAEGQAHIEQTRRWEVEQKAERQRNEERMKAEDAARRVVYSGMRLVERGGQAVPAVRPGFEDVEEPEQ